MNQRIRELWNAAAESTLDDSWEGEVAFMARFAQLIVRECVSVCEQHPSRILSNNWPTDEVALDIVSRLEKHFGVEQ